MKNFPTWLASQNEDDVANKHYKRSIRYYKKLYMAWPEWADNQKINAFYAEAKRLRAAGQDAVVDHIVPISHPHVSGLHNEFNLQIISEGANLFKSNRFWPGMWGEQIAIPLREEVHQYGFPI